MTTIRAESISQPDIPGHASFTVERRYAASVAKVFSAFSDPELKRAWYAEGPGFHVGSHHLDFRVGGREVSAFTVDTPEFKSPAITNDTYFFDIVPQRRIVFGYSMANAGTPFSISLTTLVFEPDGQGTKLTHQETVQFLDGADGVHMRASGTRQLLERLAQELGEEFDEGLIQWPPASGQ